MLKMVKILIRWWQLCTLILCRIKQKLSVFPRYRKSLREANLAHEQILPCSCLKDWDAWSWHSVLSLGMLSTEFSMALRRMMRVVQDLERLPLLLFDVTGNGPVAGLSFILAVYNFIYPFLCPITHSLSGVTMKFLSYSPFFSAFYEFVSWLKCAQLGLQAKFKLRDCVLWAGHLVLVLSAKLVFKSS